MKTKTKTEVIKDLKERSITVIREFDAPIENVWRAFTEPELLDQWFGPAPWHAETKSMNFKVGGYWLFAMVGPENQKHWGRMSYIAIDPLKSFDMDHAFCDENGNVNPDFPASKDRISFIETANGIKVEFKLTYATETALQQNIEMGFEQGITVCMDQLEELFAKNKI